METEELGKKESAMVTSFNQGRGAEKTEDEKEEEAGKGEGGRKHGNRGIEVGVSDGDRF